MQAALDTRIIHCLYDFEGIFFIDYFLYYSNGKIALFDHFVSFLSSFM